MGTRKIKDAKDLDTGEKIYLKGHAQATYMSDGSTVEDTINQVVGGNTEKLVVTVSGISEGYTIYVMDEDDNIIDSQTTSFKTYRIPAGTKYYVKGNNIDTHISPNNTEIRTAYAYAENTVEMIYTKLYITKIRINQNLTDPDSMITRIVDGGGIEAIRANSHRYTGIYLGEATMKIKQLDDNDGTKYLDGSTVDLTSLDKDIWMKLPQFYWKCEEHTADIWDFSVCYGVKPDDTWKEWDGKDLIGVYEACYATYSSLNYRSLPGYIAVTNVPLDTFQYVVNGNSGFSLVKWKHHCMMAMLFYTWYGTTDSITVCGINNDYNNIRKTGETESLGMTDTVNSGSPMSINFWGLENWWGNNREWIDNVIVNGDNWIITEEDGQARTAKQGGNSGDGTVRSGFISKMVFGENIDLIWSDSTNATETTGFCDSYYIKFSTGRAARRACGGMIYLNTYDTPASKSTECGGRLAFRGEIVIES